ncbi:hypothetical protein [Chelatococcus reniformis]|uniref:N-terminal of MaoC-like dehydratase domain-containing protein n=1 Tax=Chelatococcus reniformis TaxID=1494448 RepID=A0A916X990_9HYPH|nr:hypothetical protein [Chelatococcus reniformis]GGC56658.1 hypothetical protein GCM10010994_14500 [Chelatococcus reniformis]
MDRAFSTEISEVGDAIAGPLRGPRQMLATQEYDDHASIHDDATAQKLGFKGGTIEGPTHFSQFAPLGEAIWGRRWLEEGCLSAHYRNPCFEGEQVRAFMRRPAAGATHTTVWMEKEDGTEVLRGSASVGAGNPPTALEERLKTLAAPELLVILRDVKVGWTSGRVPVTMGPTQNMGALYPFSLADKLKVITEPSSWYQSESDSPWQQPIIPMEMISVLLSAPLEGRIPARGPAVGLFADQEIRLVKGPLFVGAPYEMEREVVALSGSRRTESAWLITRVYQPGGRDVIATMLLNTATLKDSYESYEVERQALEGAKA